MPPPFIFVINLTRDAERWERISAALAATGLPFRRVPAIDGRGKFGLVRKLIRRPYSSAVLGRRLTPGECCCSLSHIAALKRGVRMRLPSFVVLEDDAEFDTGFAQLVTADLPKFLCHCDIVKLEGIEYYYTSKSGPVLARGAIAKLIVPLRPTLGAAAYAVTQSGARRLIEAFSPLSDPLDHMLAYYDRHRIAYGEIRPFAVRQAEMPSNLDADRNSLTPGAYLSPHGSHTAARMARGAVRLLITARVIAAAWLRGVLLAGRS